MRRCISFLLTTAVGLGTGCGGGTVSTGDFDRIRDRGTLRILTHSSGDGYLPRDGYPLDRELSLARRFAQNQGLKAETVAVERFSDLIPALQRGEGDLIAANMTVLDSRLRDVDFTVPVGSSHELIVSRAGEPAVAELDDLSGRTIAVQEGTSFMETARYIQTKFPEVTVKTIPGNLSQDEILDRVAAGTDDLTVDDSNVLAAALAYRDDVIAGVRVTNECDLAWAVRKGNPELRKRLDLFLDGAAARREGAPRTREDLPGIKQRNVLRILTVNNAACYFIYRGELLGFEYELAAKFAESLGVEPRMVVAPAYGDLIPWLLEGRGDLIAASMTPTDTRKDRGAAFTVPYDRVREMLVARPGENVPKTARDLAGKTITVRKDSSYRRTLEKIRAAGVDLRIADAPADLQTEELIAGVADGTYDYTAADSNILDIELAWGVPVIGAFPLPPEEVPHCWAVRKTSPELLEAADAFLSSTYRSAFYNIAYRKYFRDPRGAGNGNGPREVADGAISPYDALARKYGERYSIPWLLIVAQMYQESRFRPDAVSWAGARGLLQVMPATARELKLSPLDDPETGTHAGVKYLSLMRDRLQDKTADPGNRLWFSLAAYNAGVGHVFDAIRLARQQGWKPDLWFENVERAMLLLAQPEYAAKARYGYVRGKDVAGYVKKIRDRFRAYEALAGAGP